MLSAADMTRIVVSAIMKHYVAKSCVCVLSDLEVEFDDHQELLKALQQCLARSRRAPLASR